MSEEVVSPDSLRGGAVGLGTVLMQGISTIAPSLGAALAFQLVVSQAGLAAPIVFVIAFLIVAMLAVSVGQLAKEMPSAGGLYEFARSSVGPRAGRLVGYFFIFWFGSAPVMLLAFTAKAILAPVLATETGVDLPWWLFVLLGVGLVGWITYRGIEVSQKAIVFLGLAELLIVVVLAAQGLIDPGPGGFTFRPFDPGASTSTSGLYLGVVFAIFSFAGWEGAAPMAEETASPRHVIPRAMFWSVALTATFYVFVTWGSMVGYGTDELAKASTASEIPLFSVAQRLWGGAWLVIVIAILNSALAVALASFIAGTRMWFAMAREGDLPRSLGHVDAGSRAPRRAVWLQAGLSAVAFTVAVAGRPIETFSAWALGVTLALIVCYCIINFGVLRYFSNRTERSVLLHGAFPVISTAAVLWVGYKSVVPWPAVPGRYGVIAIFVWALASSAAAYLRGGADPGRSGALAGRRSQRHVG